MEKTGKILVVLVAIYDLTTTAVGFTVIFGAHTIMQFIFCGVAALAFSLCLVMTVVLVEAKMPIGLAIPVWSFWLFVLLFNIFTTFAGNTAIATGNEFSKIIYNIGELFHQMNNVQSIIVAVTTLFVVACTFLIGYLLRKA